MLGQPVGLKYKEVLPGGRVRGFGQPMGLKHKETSGWWWGQGPLATSPLGRRSFSMAMQRSSQPDIIQIRLL